MTSVSTKDVGKLTDDQLAEESESLAKLRTEVRLRQNDVNGEIELRQRLQGMSESARGRIRSIKLEGSIAPEGSTSGGK